MANNLPDPVYFKVRLHYNGTFVRHPCSYAEGESYLFTDFDFAAMNLHACGSWLERFTGSPCEGLFYCIPNKPLSTGIRPIENDLDYAQFLDEATEAYESNMVISLYMDHTGSGLEEWFDEDMNLVLSPEGEDEVVDKEDEVVDKEDEVVDQGDVGVQKEAVVEEEFPNFKDLDDWIGEEEVPKMNKTCDDQFLGKMCSEETHEETQAGVEHCIFNENIPWKNQCPVLGMRFENPKQLKHMLCNYAVANGYQLCFNKNDNQRLLVLCCKGDCSFRLWASWMGDEHSFQIKSLKSDHTCARNYKLGSIVTYKWIGSHYTKEMLHRQKLTIRQLRLEVIKKFGIDVSLSQCRRARQHAMSLIEGTLTEHYAKLWSYGAEITRTNPGSTVKVEVNPMPDGKNYFSKFYVCFEAIKKGWIEGCRRVIGIDGCFLKGICCGELLCAIGRDANNQLFPIAWAVVCVENKENWKWFLDLLRDDLDLAMGNDLTLMSDQHKGLMEAVKELLPQAEHRQCARHICANLKKKFPGAHFENLFWKASNATTEQHFKQIMKELELLCPPANQFLMDKDPKTWSKAYFQTGRGCASNENGLCESFNAVIVEARRKPIITMLEELRLYMMERMFKMNGRGWTTDISPWVRHKLNDLKMKQRYWEVLPSGFHKFETRCAGDAYEVDLEKRICSCRLWQLNGYGCVHSVASICYLNKQVESYVHEFFSRDMYLKAYKHTLSPMNGSNMWPETPFTPPLPPKSRRMPGRPTVNRRKDVTEKVGKHRVSKVGKKMSCSICHEPGHNKARCPKLPNPAKQNVKRARTMPGNQVPVEGNGDNEVPMATEDVPMPPEFPMPTEDVTIQCDDAPVPSQTDVSSQSQHVPMTSQSEDVPLSHLMHDSRFGCKVKKEKMDKIRKSERIVKKKLAMNVIGKNGEGNSVAKPVTLE